MSYSARERLRMKLEKEKKEFLERHTELSAEDIKWLTENYIEEICAESDKRCNKIDPLKAVDQVIDEMDDEAFDKFIKGVLEEIKARLEKTKKLNKLIQKKKNKEQNETEDEEETEQTSEKTEESDSQTKEEPIPA